MTARVPPRLRKIYRKLAAELDDTTMEELQAVALRAFLANFREWTDLQTKWDALRQMYGEIAKSGD
jgi:hypothetical protein